jgi:REP element-mobilizing transposase RayT
MPQSYASLNYHIVFSTKDRVPVLTPELLSDVYTFIGSVLKARGGILVSSGGLTDHIHLLVDVSREASLSQTVRDIKSLSSGWIHRTREDLEISRGSLVTVHSRLGIHRWRLSNVIYAIRCLTIATCHSRRNISVF